VSVRLVITDTDVAWDGALQHVPAGTILDIPPGSLLEAAYGPANLQDLDTDAAAAAAAAGAGVSN
jgi:hypothetical protein